MGQISFSDYVHHHQLFLKTRLTVNRVSEETVKANKKDLKSFIGFAQDKNVKYVNGHLLYDYFSYLTENRKLKAVSANRKLETLKTYNKYLCLMDVSGARDLPIKEMTRIRDGYGSPMQTLEFCEVKKMFERLQEFKGKGNANQDLTVSRDYVLFMLQYQLGLRIGEVHRISLSDIDWDKNTLLIKGKGKCERICPLLDKLSKLLKKYCKTIRREYLNWQTNPALFLSKKGKRLSIRTMEDNFQKYFIDFYPRSCRRLTPHTLRHAFATHFMADHPEDIITLKAILGHKSTRSTEIYLHPTITMLRKSIEEHPAVLILNKILREKEMEKYLATKNVAAG